MDWFWMSNRDQRYNNWILYLEGPPVELRPRYHVFRCSTCGKVNEELALQSGFDDDVELKSRFDVFSSDDGVICFRERAREIFLRYSIQGLEFLPLPIKNKQNHQVALPKIITSVNRETAGFQYNRFLGRPSLDNAEVFCLVCHRPKEGAYVGPFLESMQLPDDPLCITSPSIPRETWRGKNEWILVSGVVKKILSKEKLIGVEFVKPL